MGIVIFWFFVFGFAGNCEKFHERKYRITIENASPHPIQYYVAGLGTERLYPDTLLPGAKPPFAIISPTRQGYYDQSGTWESYFELLPADTLSIFIFHADTVAKYPWDIVREEYKVLQRFDLSLEQLKSNNYIVTYSE